MILEINAVTACRHMAGNSIQKVWIYNNYCGTNLKTAIAVTGFAVRDIDKGVGCQMDL